jgi:tetratricopeptide (TPR) repeat protein
VQVLYRRQKYAQSLAESKNLLDAEPDNLDYRVSYANQCVAVSDYDTALEIYDYAVGRVDNAHALHLLRGHALKTIGQLEPAIEAYRQAYQDRSDFGDAYWSLANLKTYEFSDEEVDRMGSAEAADTTTSEDRIHLCFALGTHYERQADHESAMSHYRRGNRLKKEELRYDADRMSTQLDLQIKHCDPRLFECNKGSGCASPDPIFIVGMPRAGSTLLEQILASHSEVDGTFELPNIPALAFRLSGRRNLDEEPRYPAVLPELTPQQLKQFGESFLEDTKIHRKGAPRFIDKMPNNFRHLGLISMILPNARIIDARREPMACCFSGFKQLFSSGQEFTYGLREIGQYYADYVRLMAHWGEVLPGKILRVDYEDTVADLETQVRRILEFCELPYEQACVDFHQTRRSIRTPSSEQVRQPIYTSGLEYWRQFDPWLNPLRAALGDLAPS